MKLNLHKKQPAFFQGFENSYLVFFILKTIFLAIIKIFGIFGYFTLFVNQCKLKKCLNVYLPTCLINTFSVCFFDRNYRFQGVKGCNFMTSHCCFIFFCKVPAFRYRNRLNFEGKNIEILLYYVNHKFLFSPEWCSIKYFKQVRLIKQ